MVFPGIARFHLAPQANSFPDGVFVDTSVNILFRFGSYTSVADPGEARGPCPSGPVKGGIYFMFLGHPLTQPLDPLLFRFGSHTYRTSRTSVRPMWSHSDKCMCSDPGYLRSYSN